MVKWLALVTLCCACTSPKTAFECTENAQCRNGSEAGVCTQTGYCGFSDPACPTGYRYGDGARELSGQCVDLSGGGDAGIDASPENVMLGAWGTRNALPVPRYTMSGVAVDQRIYVMGGIAGASPKAEVTVGSVIGGSVTWMETTPLPAMRRNTGAATNGEAVFVLGGREDSEADSDIVLASSIQTDGTLGAWQPTLVMPSRKRGHMVVSQGQYLYVVGGKSSNTVVQDVLVGTMSGATITEWRQAGLIPKPVALGAAVISGPYLYVIAGCARNANGCAATDLSASVYVAPIRLDGKLGPFVETTALPAARWHHAATVTNGRILVLAGDEAGMNGSTRVFSAPVQAMGMLGAWRQENGLPTGGSGRKVAVVADGHAFLIASQVFSAPFQ